MWKMLIQDMEISYVLIQCELGHEAEIIKKLLEMSQISEVRGTFGVFDIFVRIQTEAKDETEEIITKIRKIPHISGTNTLMAILSQGGR